MIIVKLRGGLGNQMFQYATGMTLARLNNTRLKLDVSWFKNCSADTPRKYELSIFNVKESFSSVMETNIFRASFMLPFLNHCYMKETSFLFDPAVLKIRKNVFLDGYWQSHKYFEWERGLIRQALSFKTAPQGKNLLLAQEIQRSDRSPVAVHFRRSDYVTNPKISDFHGVCSPAYYQAAMAYVDSHIQKAHFYIFSDDPEWVRKNSPITSNFTLIDHNGPDTASEDLRLMTLCQHHVIANSTFSWWGAWLSSNPEKLVIVPKKWFKDPHMDAKDLIPDGWITL